MKTVLTFVAALAAAVCAATVQAQAYPSKPIRLVLPLPPGGSTDPSARLVASKVGPRLGQAVLVENIAGGSGVIGMTTVSRAAPDGYTLLFGTPTQMVTGPLLSASPQYDPIRDYEPVTQLVSNPFVLVVPTALPVKSIKDLISLAKAKPGTLNFGSPGEGGQPHIAVELLKSMAGIDIVHVPYKGGGPAQVDLVAGRIQLYASSIIGVSGAIKAGKLRPIAVSSMERAGVMPDVPTVHESGVPDYQFDTWYGIFAPAKTPSAIINRLNTEFAAAMKDPEMVKLLESQGSDIRTTTPAALGALVKSENERLGQLIKKIGLKAQ